jgi:hypothetical protein
MVISIGMRRRNGTSPKAPAMMITSRPDSSLAVPRARDPKIWHPLRPELPDNSGERFLFEFFYPGVLFHRHFPASHP